LICRHLSCIQHRRCVFHSLSVLLRFLCP